jgi:RNA polymerase sigma-70 factor (ECF subfamily)
LDRDRAFDALFRANYQGLRRVATRILGSPAEADELVQDLFLWVWERCRLIDESTPSRAYLYRAAHNAALNRLRHQRIEERWMEEQPDAKSRECPSAVEVEHDELLGAVQSAIARLPLRCGLIYTMSRQEGLTYQEIADALSLSVKTVEAQMARAFRLLRKALAPHLLASVLVLAALGGSR